LMGPAGHPRGSTDVAPPPSHSQSSRGQTGPDHHLR